MCVTLPLTFRLRLSGENPEQFTRSGQFGANRLHFQRYPDGRDFDIVSAVTIRRAKPFNDCEQSDPELAFGLMETGG
jgi:hypothetical protein